MTQTLSSNVNSDIQGVAQNDIYLDDSGNIAMSFDLQAVLQECSQVARTILGEMIFNTDLGLPYFQVLWIGVPNVPQFIATLRRSFLNVDGVLEVVSLTTSQGGTQPSDTFIYTAIIRTIYGTGVVNG